MNSMKSLLGMIATDAIERGGAPRVHYHDEFRNREYINNQRPPEPPRDAPKLPPINYTLQLIENPDKTLEWIE